MFCVVSSSVPSHWVHRKGGHLGDLMPWEWLEDGFFEMLFGGDTSARQVFDREYHRTLRSEE